MKADGDDAVRVRLSGDVAVPRGGLVVTSPYDRPIRRVTVDGRAVTTFTDAAVTVDRCPADVVLHYEPAHTAVPGDAANG